MHKLNALRAIPHGWPLSVGGVDWGWGNDPEGGRHTQDLRLHLKMNDGYTLLRSFEFSPISNGKPANEG